MIEIQNHIRLGASLHMPSVHAGLDSRKWGIRGRLGLATIATFALAIIVAPGHSAETIPTAVDTQLPYPAAVSLLQESGGWTFRQNNTNAPLYFNENDSPDKSVCDSACETQWFPLKAKSGEKSLGEWTVFRRKDGRRQWAFKKRPVYTHIHDSPDKPNGDGIDGVWRLMPHFPAAKGGGA